MTDYTGPGGYYENRVAKQTSPQVNRRVELDEFESLASPLIRWLNDHCHPHHTIIITPTNAELLEGVASTGEILDYLRD